MAAKGYWREISAVLVLKTIGIVLLYCLFVASVAPAALTSASVAQHLAPAASDQPTPPSPLPEAR